MIAGTARIAPANPGGTAWSCGRAATAAPEPKRRHSDPFASFEHPFEVGPHDVQHPADTREAVEIVGRHLLLFPGILQRLDGCLGADLVSELEAVGHRLGGRVDSDRHPGNGMVFDPFVERWSREVVNIQSEGLDSRDAGMAFDGDPDRPGAFGGEFVEPER